MAGSSFFALLDDIATLLDDVSLMTKVAAKKTAGVLGDDLALNAQQVTGVHADRELPVVWAVAKGSLLNKAILVPAALLISWLAHWAIMPLLMFGGLYLCYEGFEKLAHVLFHKPDEAAQHHAALVAAVNNEQLDLVDFEKNKVKGAIRTDFVLSAEIIVITLGTVAAANLGQQVAVLVGISLLMTVGVYGLVAGIVKLDDAGLYLTTRAQAWQQSLGRAVLVFAPWLMKALSVVGTAAMFLVGGGILLHGLPFLHHALTPTVPGWNWLLPWYDGLLGAVFGLTAGALGLMLVKMLTRLRQRA
jgi:uncharacterized protein